MYSGVLLIMSEVHLNFLPIVRHDACLRILKMLPVKTLTDWVVRHQGSFGHICGLEYLSVC